MLLIEGECAFVLCVCFEFWLSDHHSHRNACIRMYDDCVFVSSFGYPTITHKNACIRMYDANSDSIHIRV